MQTNHLHTDLFLHGGKIHKNIDIELLKSAKVSKDIDFSDPELIVDYREDFTDETHDYKPDPETIDFTPVIEELNNKVSVNLQAIAHQFNVDLNKTPWIDRRTGKLTHKAPLYIYPGNSLEYLEPYEGINSGDIVNIIMSSNGDNNPYPYSKVNFRFRKSIDIPFYASTKYSAINKNVLRLDLAGTFNLPEVDTGIDEIVYPGVEILGNRFGYNYYDTFQKLIGQFQSPRICALQVINYNFWALIQSSYDLLLVGWNNSTQSYKIIDKFTNVSGSALYATIFSVSYGNNVFVGIPGKNILVYDTNTLTKTELTTDICPGILSFNPSTSNNFCSTGYYFYYISSDNKIFEIPLNNINDIIEDTTDNYGYNNPNYKPIILSYLSSICYTYQKQDTYDNVLVYQNFNDEYKELIINDFEFCYRLNNYEYLLKHNSGTKSYSVFNTKYGKFSYIGNNLIPLYSANQYFSGFWRVAGYENILESSSIYGNDYIPYKYNLPIPFIANSTKMVKLKYSPKLDDITNNEYFNEGGPHWEILEGDNDLNTVLIDSEKFRETNFLISKSIDKIKEENFDKIEVKNTQTYELQLKNGIKLKSDKIEGFEYSTKIKTPLLYNWNLVNSGELISTADWRIPNIDDVTSLLIAMLGPDIYSDTLSDSIGVYLNINNNPQIRNIDGTFYQYYSNSAMWIKDEVKHPYNDTILSTILFLKYDKIDGNSIHKFIGYETSETYKKLGLPVRLVRSLDREEYDLPNFIPMKPYVGNNGLVYETIKIGDFVWTKDFLAETLASSNGALKFLTNVISTTEWQNQPIDNFYAYCAYNNDLDNVIEIKQNILPKPMHINGMAKLNFNINSKNIRSLNIEPLRGLEYYFDRNSNGYWQADNAPLKNIFTSSDVWRTATIIDLDKLLTTEGVTVQKLRSKLCFPEPLVNIDNFGWYKDSNPGTDDFGFNLLPSMLSAISNDSVTSQFTNYTFTSTGYTTGTGVNYAYFRVVRDATESELLLDDGTPCDNYVGNNELVYGTVKIGTLVWTTANSCETLYRDGVTINDFRANQYSFRDKSEPLKIEKEPGYLTKSNLDFLKLKDNKKLLIDYIKEYNLSINYGYLYNWYMVEFAAQLTSSDDWKVPTQVDYTTLFTTIGAGYLDKLKTVDKWVTPGTNDFGFNLVPGGIRSSSNGIFSLIDEQANYWTIDEDSPTTAFVVNFTNTVQTVNNIHKYTGASIRLVRETSVEEQLLADGTKCAPYIGNDLKTYDTVKIGTQVWLAYNLCETKFRNNTDGILIEVDTNWATQEYYPKYCAYNNIQSSAYVEEIKDINLSQYVTKEELNINIEDSVNWDGTNHVIDLSISRFYTLKVNNGVVTLNFSVNFPDDANEKMREVIVLIDNSENASTIATVNFTGATWKWSAGDPIQGLAPGAKCELVVRNRNNTTVKGITDIES